MVTQFTPLQSLVGGGLIGLSAALLMMLHGRIAGITGVLSGLLPPIARDADWRIAFLAGLIAAPFAYIWVAGSGPLFASPASMPALVIGGALVGAGVSLGSGCTSGHGVCGLARFSRRSLVAVLCFMSTAVITVFVVRHLVGGA
jgi:uncharacterized membrane protein YedE/YeeE